MAKETTIKISKKGLNKLRKRKRGGQTYEQVIFSRPLITNILSKKNLAALRKRSFVERNFLIQRALEDFERKRRKNR